MHSSAKFCFPHTVPPYLLKDPLPRFIRVSRRDYWLYSGWHTPKDICFFVLIGPTMKKAIFLIGLILLVPITPVIAADTPTVSAGDTTVKSGNDAQVGVQLDSIPNGIQDYNITISISNGEIADITDATAGDITGDQFTIVSSSSNSITVKGVDLLDSIQAGDGPVDLGTIHFTTLSEGTSTIAVEVNSLTNDNGDPLDHEIQNGELTVTETAAITTASQTVINGSFTAANVFLPNGGYVVAFNQTGDGSPDSVIGHSEYLSSGSHADITFKISPTRSVEQTVIVGAHADEDGDQIFDSPEVDGAYTDAAGEPIRDTAHIEFPYGFTRLGEGSVVWQGQSLYRSTGVAVGEQTTLHFADDTFIRNISDSDYDGAVTFDTANLTPDSYALKDAEGGTIASFDVQQQNVEVSLDQSTVSNSGENTTLTSTVTSDREGYPLEIGSNTLSKTDLQSVFGGTIAESGVVFTNSSATTTLQANFTGVSPGQYNISFGSADANAETTAAITVEKPTTTTVDVTLSGAPNGLRKYNVTVEGPKDASVNTVEPDLIGGTGFQIVSTADGRVTARAVDLVGLVGPFETEEILYTATYAGTIESNNITVKVNTLVDNDGNPMDKARVNITVIQQQGLFDEPLFPGAPNPPEDPDGDGLYEDLNGDGAVNFGDAISLAFLDTGALTPEQRLAFDFTGDGEVTFGDAVELAFQA